MIWQFTYAEDERRNSEKFFAKGSMRKYMKYILPSFVFLFILVLWELIVDIKDIPLYVLPSPIDVIKSLINDFHVLMMHSIVTASEGILGIIIAALLAIILAIFMDNFKGIKAAIYPLLVISQTIPVIVLAPILMIYLGFGIAPKILIVVLMCFFPVCVSFCDGLAKAEKKCINLVKSFGGSRFQVYSMVKIPSALNELFSGLKVAATYSISGAVVGEWLSAQEGLGYYMIRVKNGYMLDKVFASVVLVIILSLLMNGIVKLIQYIVMPHIRGNQED